MISISRVNPEDNKGAWHMNSPSVFRPIMFAVDDEPEGLNRVERELNKRYGADYRVVCKGSAESGLRQLRDLKVAGEDVAVVLADQRMPGMSGIEFLSRAHQIYPVAKRLLLIGPMDTISFWEASRAMALGRIDYVEYTSLALSRTSASTRS